MRPGTGRKTRFPIIQSKVRTATLPRTVSAHLEVSIRPRRRERWDGTHHSHKAPQELRTARANMARTKWASEIGLMLVAFLLSGCTRNAAGSTEQQRAASALVDQYETV